MNRFSVGFVTACMICVFMMIAAAAWGAEVEMPIRVSIIQCGPKENIEDACRADDRCCVFIEPSAGDADDEIPSYFQQDTFDLGRDTGSAIVENEIYE
ncbi:MAG: hypothetical protein GC149_20530 [Gammaproteobacteria bacterium]|nr:hypothetical protein [Gammaproteobacteria bacterium]